MAKIGDIVRYLNAVGGGKIVRIDGNMAWVDDDGFETPVLLRECVVVQAAGDAAALASADRNDATAVSMPSQHNTSTSAPAKSGRAVALTREEDEPESAPVEEVAGGNVLNIVLGFEPTDRSRLSESAFDASLINDSNYYLYFVLASRGADEMQWTTRHAGLIEPNTDLWLGEFSRADVAACDNLAFDYIAFKKRPGYDRKAPGHVALKVDTTKFFKLHCFRPNAYYDNDVLAFDLVKNDEPFRPVKIDSRKLAASMTRKDAPARPVKRPVAKTASDEPLVVDLHINELLDNTRGMSSADILNYQVDTFRRIMDENLRNFGRKIVFIHGKGDGVLRQALTKELNNRYRGHDACDASFAEYGYGATQVTIRQYPDKNRKK